MYSHIVTSRKGAVQASFPSTIIIDSSRTTLQLNNTIIELHDTKNINKIKQQEATNISLRLLVKAPKQCASMV